MTSTHQPLLHLGLRVKWVHQGRVPPLTPITLGDGCAVKSSPLREGDGDSLPGRHPGGDEQDRCPVRPVTGLLRGWLMTLTVDRSAGEMTLTHLVIIYVVLISS